MYEMDRSKSTVEMLILVRLIEKHYEKEAPYEGYLWNVQDFLKEINNVTYETILECFICLESKGVIFRDGHSVRFDPLWKQKNK